MMLLLYVVHFFVYNRQFDFDKMFSILFFK